MYEVDDKTVETAIRVVKHYQEVNSNTPHISIGCGIAIAALKMQLPKRPATEVDKLFGDTWTVCPNCGNRALVNVVNVKCFKHCPDCGQALDWKESDGE